MKCLLTPLWVVLAYSVTACATDTTPPEDDDSVADDDTAGDDDDAAADPAEEKDIPYPPPEGGDPDLALLDIYYQPDGQPRGLLVFVHGGSWVSGDKENLAEAPDLVPWFLGRGYVVAAVNFRLASTQGGPQEVTCADQATDIAHALAWLRDHGADYGVTEPATVLMGYSSGAHLVALLAADERYLDGVGMSHTDLAGVMSFDVHAYDVPYALELMQGSVVEDNIPLIEYLFGDTEEAQREGSPSAYVASAAVPPSLILSAEPSLEEVGSHGHVAGLASQRHADLLLSHGREATWIHYDEESHSSLVLDFGGGDDGPTEAVADFLGVNGAP